MHAPGVWGWCSGVLLHHTTPGTGAADEVVLVHPCPVTRCKGVDDNPVLIADTEAMCRYHREKVRQAVNEMPSVYHQLRNALFDASARGEDAKVQVSFSAPIPMNVAARSLQDDMLALVRNAERGYRQRRGHDEPAPHQGREQVALRIGVAFVVAHLDAILVDEPRIGLDALRIRRYSRSLLGLDTLVHRLPAPCPECDCMGLRRRSGEAWVRCRFCGLTFDEQHYGVLVRVLADANRGSS